MSKPTPAQHDRFREMVDETAEELVGQPREDVMAKIEEKTKDGALESEVGPLRFGFRQAVLQELEKKTNKLR